MNPDDIVRNKAARESARSYADLMDEDLATMTDGQKGRFLTLLADWLEARRPKPPDPKGPMTEAEAARFEVGPVPFGEFVGRQAGDVPLERLEWYADQRWVDDLRRYLASRRIAEERHRADEEDWEDEKKEE